MAFERVHGPIGQRRDDILTAMILAMIANTNRPKGKAAVPVEKFLPNWDHDRPQSDDEMWAAIRQANDAMGGTTSAGADEPRRGPRKRMRPKFQP